MRMVTRPAPCLFRTRRKRWAERSPPSLPRSLSGPELQSLGIGRFSVIKRARAKRHLIAVSIALWHVALEKSFPNDADTFYERFTATYPPITGERGSAKKLRELVSRYDELIAEKKDGDFTGVADTLVATLRLQEEDKRRQQLRISLQIRTLFEFIFEKLI